jgi:Holliday junction DNA helicase RuvA
VIASITGVVKSSLPTSAVIEVGGVGMLVNLPAKTAAALVVGKTTEIYTSLVVREDSLTLYGFESQLAREYFELLQSVSGIGPKVSQSALSIYEPEEIAAAISSGDSALLERIPGLGKKGVQRLILELKDKVSGSSGVKSKSGGWRIPLESALSGLGFSAKEIEKVLNQISEEVGNQVSDKSQSELLKLALQIKGRG